MKRILIVGPHSYIGSCFQAYLQQRPEQYEAASISVRDNMWQSRDFSEYDAVLYAAAIVHQRETDENRSLYEQVNCQLAAELAQKAKREGVRQFIYLSSASVYGVDEGVLTPETKPAPVTAYGRSKLHAEEELRPLADSGFQVTLLRIPMVYGPGCKGNYRMLEKLAGVLPFFADYPNQRSRISIDTLCAFLRRCIDTPESGLYFPQDGSYSCTCKELQTLAAQKGRKLPLWKWLNPAVWLLAHTTQKGRKAFGTLIYRGDPHIDGERQPISVSLVTATYNSEKTLARTIESVLAQTVPCKEYTIMDGASADGTVAVAHRYDAAFAEKGIIYRVISEPDRGMYDAINKAVALSTGTIVGNVNSDDYYEPIAVETVIEEYKKQPYDMIYGDLRVVRRSGSFIKKAKLKRFVSTRYWNHPTMFVTKETYNKEQYRLQSMYDDCDLMLRLRKGHYRVRVVDRVLSNFTFGEGMSTKKDIHQALSRAKLRTTIYRQNGYSWVYVVESYILELVKYLMA